MKSADLVRQMQRIGHLPEMLPATWRAAAGVAVRGVTADSREAGDGALFVAIPGRRADGRAFIADAVSRGAAVVLAPPGTEWPAGVPPRPLIEDPEPRRRLAQIAATLAGAQPATQVAVTGTNGKTSTVDFLRQIWTLAGRRAASLGTLGVIARGFETGPGLTTPDPVALATIVAALARSGVRCAALEASSHGLDQCRLDGLLLTAGGITNLTRDHLDYHGTMAAYRAAKLRLFAELLPPRAVAVASTALDAETMAALRGIAAARRLDLRSVGEDGSALRLLTATAIPEGQVLRIVHGTAQREVFLPLPGRFQVENALLAAALAMATGVGEALDLLMHLRGVRGRLELAAMLPNDAAVYVDYAHTPDALARVLTALRPHTSGALHVVFGAGGDRDAGKRPMMGEVAARLADHVIVTDDNPRHENAASIRAAVLAGCPGAAEIAGREAAIAAGLAAVAGGDVLVIAGKGHEQGQIVGDEELPFDDVAVVRRLAGIG